MLDYIVLPQNELNSLPCDVAEDFEDIVLAMDDFDTQIDFEVAAKDFRELLAKAPGARIIQLYLGVALACARHDGEALSVLQELKALHPDFLYAHAILMRLFLDMKDFTKVTKLIRDTIIPDNAPLDMLFSYYCTVAYCLNFMGLFPLARKYMDAAKRLDPKNKEYMKLYKDLEKDAAEAKTIYKLISKIPQEKFTELVNAMIEQYGGEIE